LQNFRETIHGVRLRFELEADEQPPAEAWGTFKLRKFEPVCPA
jgi:hypothetical protein